jgi:ATP-dependent DNA helicase RecG
MPLSPDIPISEHFRITPVQKDALKKLGMHTLQDLLYHFPVRYGDTAEARSIDSLKKGDAATIYGKISHLKASKGFKTRITMATATVEDETGTIQCVWFNQPYIAKMTPEGALVRIEGKVSQRRSKKASILPTDKFSGTEPVADMGEGALRGSTERARGISQQGNIRAPEPISAEGDNSGKLYFSNPKIELVDKLPIGVGDSLFGPPAGGDGLSHTLYPVYPESRGVTSLWIYHALQKLFKSGILDTIQDPIPTQILKKYNLPSIKTAFIWMHTPQKNDDALSARKRFSFQEIFTIQIARQQARKQYEQYPSFVLKTDMEHVHEFIRRFPFQATSAQTRAIETIISDMSREQPMSRLLEGDVGSGKTAVAAATAYAVMHARLQVAYMCPTEILAAQHFESFIQYFSYMPVRIALITGSGCRVFPSKVNPKSWTDISRSQLLKWVADGSIAVIIGTQALIQKSVKFKQLAYAIIDEQHRFGIGQRRRLVQKNVGQETSHALRKSSEARRRRETGADSAESDAGSEKHVKFLAPHLLSMTATPIPRTLALTIYGDLDLTLLDQSPAGRKPIITELVLPHKRSETYEKIRHELVAGRQLYVICPRIDEPDPDKEAAIVAKSVKEEAKRLKKSIFPEYEISILHSKMKPKEKDSTMEQFNNGTIQILCATSVVEVGVNVPNATVIIIEGAERFGLAQLHQLRGRVMRSTHQAYCYAFTETNSAKSIERLRALATAKNSFELAELDLAQRGAGELSGLRQWGVSDVAMEALKNLKMVEAARSEAIRLIDEDVTLSKYPLLKSAAEQQSADAHFE